MLQLSLRAYHTDFRVGTHETCMWDTETGMCLEVLPVNASCACALESSSHPDRFVFLGTPDGVLLVKSLSQAARNLLQVAGTRLMNVDQNSGGVLGPSRAQTH